MQIKNRIVDLAIFIAAAKGGTFTPDGENEEIATGPDHLTRLAFLKDTEGQTQVSFSTDSARVGIMIPPDFHDQRSRNREASFLALIDGSDSNVSAQALASINGMVAAHNLDLAKAAGARPQLAVHPVILFNPGGRTANFIIPGLVAILLQIAAMMLAAIESDYTLAVLVVAAVWAAIAGAVWLADRMWGDGS